MDSNNEDIFYYTKENRLEYKMDKKDNHRFQDGIYCFDEEDDAKKE